MNNDWNLPPAPDRFAPAPDDEWPAFEPDFAPAPPAAPARAQRLIVQLGDAVEFLSGALLPTRLDGRAQHHLLTAALDVVRGLLNDAERRGLPGLCHVTVDSDDHDGQVHVRITEPAPGFGAYAPVAPGPEHELDMGKLRRLVDGIELNYVRAERSSIVLIQRDRAGCD